MLARIIVTVQANEVPFLHSCQRDTNWASIPKVVGSIPTVARHIFQACPVWIYTQRNITSIIFTWVHYTNTANIMYKSVKTRGLILKTYLSITFFVCWCYVLRWIWCLWCYSVCASTPGKLKILPDHGGNRTRDLWGHMLGILSRDLWDHIISKELDSVPKYHPLEATWPRSSVGRALGLVSQRSRVRFPPWCTLRVTPQTSHLLFEAIQMSSISTYHIWEQL